MTIVILVSGCGNAYPGDGTRDGGGQVAISGLLNNHEKQNRWVKPATAAAEPGPLAARDSGGRMRPWIPAYG
jgi:hypothetical protein